MTKYDAMVVDVRIYTDTVEWRFSKYECQIDDLDRTRYTQSNDISTPSPSRAVITLSAPDPLPLGPASA